MAPRPGALLETAGNSMEVHDDQTFMLRCQNRSHSPRRTLAVVAAAALGLVACGSDDTTSTDSVPAATQPPADDASEQSAGAESAAVTMSIADAWSRQPADGQSASAAYGIVSNPGDVDVTIVSASSPVSDQVELHETLVDDDGTMSMVEREQGFVVPAGGEFVFEPGGPHVMFLGIDPTTYPDEVEVTLEFDTAAPLTFMAEVRAIEGAAGDMSHDDMSHDDMSHDDMSHDDMTEDGMTDDDAAHDDMSHGDMSHDDAAHDDGAHDDMSHDDAAHDDGAHDDMSHDDHGDLALDVSALHELDDQLANGTLDVMAQRMVVGDYIAVISEREPAPDSAEARLLSLLTELDAALEAGDLAVAAALAAEAHDVAHDMGHGHG